jgi:hypothetical protein
MKKTSPWFWLGAAGLGLATGVGLLARKQRRTSGNGNGQQGSGEGSSPGPIPKGESRSINWKGCTGTLTHLAVTDEMGNNYFWSVHRGAPENTLVASGVAKSPRAAELAMWESLRWQICQPLVQHRTVPG